MSEEERKWLEQIIRENKESDSELTYTYCPFKILYSLQQENSQLKEDIKGFKQERQILYNTIHDIQKANKQLNRKKEMNNEIV